MTNKPFLSIFLAVYNCSKYINKLLDSLKNQTCQNFEVIFVDDCSTDNSYEIIQDFINRAPKDGATYKLYKSEHNLGRGDKHLKTIVDKLNGEYYFSFTHDDFLDNDFVEKCYKKSLEGDYDIILTNLVFYENENKTYLGKDYLEKFQNKKLSNRDLFALSLSWKISVAGPRRLDFMKKTEYFNSSYYNIDEYTFRQTLLLTDKIAYVDTNYYYRVDNSNSLSRKFKTYTFDIADTFFMLINLLIEYKFPKRVIRKNIKILIKLWKHYSLEFYSNINDFNKDEQKYIIGRIEQVNNNVKKLFRYFSIILLYRYLNTLQIINHKKKRFLL